MRPPSIFMRVQVLEAPLAGQPVVRARRGAAPPGGSGPRLTRAGVRLGGQLAVVGTASEETLKCGGYQLAQDHHDADGVVCAEPSDGRVAVAATGSLALRLDAYGTGAHSSVPGGGGNAILAAQAAAKAVVDALTETVEVKYVGPRRRAVNVGVIRGGIAQPVVPQRCTVWLDVRYFVGETAAGLMERIQAACNQAVGGMTGVKIEASQQRLDYEGRPYERGTWGDFIHVERGMKAFATDPASAVVRAFRQAVKDEGGDDAIDMMRGWGDVEFVATDHGVPTIYYGPGTVAAAHTADEYIELDRYHTGVAVYERAIREFLGTV
jgi:acetylornithine deacetylase/succinyl-diaminopimelate desuccinylase-like protein